LPGGSLVSGLTIRRSRRGTCTDTGAVLPGTYVCSTHRGNHKVGLCYPKPNSSELICVTSPMAKTAVRFRSTGVLPPPVTSPNDPQPTELLLSDGSECGSVQVFGRRAKFLTLGALGHDGSLAVSYECDGPTSAVFGPIDESTDVWTVRARHTVLQGRLRIRTVKRAWL
jgi:hypothetical protein